MTLSPPPSQTTLPQEALATLDSAGRQSAGIGRHVLPAAGIGILLALSFPPFHLPFLLLPALTAFLLLLRGIKARPAFYLGFLCGLVFYGITLCWLTNMFQMAALSLWAIAAIYPALFAALFAGLRTRLPRVPEWLLAALLWTAVEYLRSEIVWPAFAWMGLGYAVVDAPLLAAFASIFGSYGLSFALVAVSAVLADVLRPNAQHLTPNAAPASPSRFARRNLARAGLLFAVWLLLLLLPRPVPAPARPLHVRLVQADSEDDESLFRLSQSTPGTGMDIFVWPEYSFVSDPRRNAKLWSKLVALPQERHGYFLFGAKDQFDLHDEAGYYNTAFLLAPNGQVVGKHVKNHPVHFFRDGVAGTEARALPTTLGRLGVGICFDMDYPDVARQLADDGAELFLVPSDNPKEWGPIQHIQHRQLFQMRAVECGRWLATADVAGSTYVVAPTGRIVRSVSTTEPATLDATVGRETGRTLFLRGGWRLGQGCLLTLVLLCAWAILPARFRSGP